MKAISATATLGPPPEKRGWYRCRANSVAISVNGVPAIVTEFLEQKNTFYIFELHYY